MDGSMSKIDQIVSLRQNIQENNKRIAVIKKGIEAAHNKMIKLQEGIGILNKEGDSLYRDNLSLKSALDTLAPRPMRLDRKSALDAVGISGITAR